jgi:hypothetical protein
LFYVSLLQVVFAEQGPDFGALPELFASPLIMLFCFLLYHHITTPHGEIIVSKQRFYK